MFFHNIKNKKLTYEMAHQKNLQTVNIFKKKFISAVFSLKREVFQNLKNLD